MLLSSGLLLGMLAVVVLLLPPKLQPLWSVGAVAAVAVYQWLLPSVGKFGIQFLGYELQLFYSRPGFELVARVIPVFGVLYFLYILNSERSRFFYFFSLLHIAAALIVLYSGDYLSFFIAWEAMTITAAILILMEKKIKIARKYLIYHIGGGVCLLAGSAVIYGALGEIKLLSDIQKVPAAIPFLIAAVAIKAAVIPMHYWLIDTYPRVSIDLAVLFSTTTTKIGAAGIILLLPGVNLELVGAVIAVGALLYTLFQKEYRKFLSYHIIGRVGFIIAGLGSGSLVARQGGFYKLVGSVIYMSLLFMCAQWLENGSGERSNKSISFSRQPFLFVVLLIGAFSVIGLPFFGGFTGKILLKTGLQSSYAVWILKFAELLTVLSFVRFFFECVFIKTLPVDIKMQLNRKLSLLGLVLLSVILGTAPGWISAGVLAPSGGYYTVSNLLESAGIILLGAGTWFIFSNYIDGFAGFIGNRSFEMGVFVNETFLEPGLKSLCLIHNGNIQRYLIWVFSALLFIWTYMYFQVRTLFY